MIGLGLRLAATGGRSARWRAGLTALGVGFGVVVLLVAASVPNVVRAFDARRAAQTYATDDRPAPGPVLWVEDASTTYHEQDIRGTRLQAIRGDSPVPPGLARLPAPGTLVVSPALRRLLERAPLLRERLPGRIVGTIGDDGLTGPRNLVFYAGARDLGGGRGMRVTRFGVPYHREPLPAFLVLILAVGVVVLLLPVGVFIATAVRFGSEARDRRLAALRLVGADRAMAVRIAAGEALFGALGGMVLGAVGFLAVRPLAEHMSLQDISVYSTDLQPDPWLTGLIVALTPVAAVVASIVALRRVVVEPLGVSRSGAWSRRRLWWRLVPLLAGGALLAGRGGDLVRGANPAVTPIAIGVGLMLVGITAVLPWAVDMAVGRLGGGGGIAGQLAVRRLQMDGGTAARAVAGVAVAVAGAIALQTVLADGRRVSTYDTVYPTRADFRVGVDAHDANPAQVLAALRATPGVRRATAVATDYAPSAPVWVGTCADLREYARLGRCRDGDTFLSATHTSARRLHRLGLGPARHVAARPGPDGSLTRGILVTPAAVGKVRPQSIDAYVDVARGDPDAIERARNALARLSPSASAYPIRDRTELSAYRTVRRAIFAGAFLVLALIAASLLVGGLEQLGERRPVLAALGAFGVPRGVLARSVLWQAAVPVVLGLAVSVTVGLVLGGLLLRVGDRPFTADWTAVALMTAAGGLVVALVTLATLPAIGRHMRPDGLRTE